MMKSNTKKFNFHLKCGNVKEKKFKAIKSGNFLYAKKNKTFIPTTRRTEEKEKNMKWNK